MGKGGNLTNNTKNHLTMPKLDLKPGHLRLLLEILRSHPPGSEVWDQRLKAVKYER